MTWNPALYLASLLLHIQLNFSTRSRTLPFLSCCFFFAGRSELKIQLIIQPSCWYPGSNLAFKGDLDKTNWTSLSIASIAAPTLFSPPFSVSTRYQSLLSLITLQVTYGEWNLKFANVFHPIWRISCPVLLFSEHTKWQMVSYGLFRPLRRHFRRPALYRIHIPSHYCNPTHRRPNRLLLSARLRPHGDIDSCPGKDRCRPDLDYPLICPRSISYCAGPSIAEESTGECTYCRWLDAGSPSWFFCIDFWLSPDLVVHYYYISSHKRLQSPLPKYSSPWHEMARCQSYVYFFVPYRTHLSSTCDY